jgi:NADPH:quinone reductase-like Zn-dependent oxidoreductase
LQFSDIDEPSPAPGQLRLAVAAASVNPYDWHILRGEPYLVRFTTGLISPTAGGLGADVAGTVVAVGEGVQDFALGDEVFGWGKQTFGESALVDAARVTHKPASMTFVEAASLPCAGVTALVSLRDKAQVTAGQRVLVNGAAGGVGTMAVQIAKYLGATVTGVCGPTSAELVRSLGADHVINYAREDFTKGPTYDVVLDVAGNRSLRSLRRAAGHDGVVVLAAGAKGKWIAPMKLVLQSVVQDRFVPQRMESLFTAVTKVDLDDLSAMFLAQGLVPVIDRLFSLADTPEAIALVEAGHVHGKVVIEVTTAPSELHDKA